MFEPGIAAVAASAFGVRAIHRRSPIEDLLGGPTFGSQAVLKHARSIRWHEQRITRYDCLPTPTERLEIPGSASLHGDGQNP